MPPWAVVTIISLDLGAGVFGGMFTRAVIIGDTTEMLVSGLVATAAVGSRLVMRQTVSR